MAEAKIVITDPRVSVELCDDNTAVLISDSGPQGGAGLPILESPNGTQFLLVVDDSGNLSTTMI